MVRTVPSSSVRPYPHYGNLKKELNAMDLPRLPNVIMAGKPDLVNLFAGLLQAGVRVPCRTDIDLETLLTDELGVDPDYLSRRISTIFLNGSCVDSLGDAVVHNDDTLALSSSMPGLAGASLRRGGLLASMRSGITLARESAQSAHHGPSQGMITVKLFNVIMAELGPAFLRRGFIVGKERLKAILDAAPDTFRERCDHVSIAGRAVSADELDAELGGMEAGEVFLRVLIAA